MALRLAWTLGCAAAVASQAAAQQVRGRTLAPGSATPVAGVIVSLVDSAGFVADRGLTSDVGAFQLRAPRAAVYRLRALRIGFRPTETPPFALAAGQVLAHSIELSSRAVTLATVQVAAQRSCDVRPDSSSSAFEVWEEARKALDAAVLTRGRRLILELVRFDRSTSARTGTVLAESEVEVRGTAMRPFGSVPVAELDSLGYVHEVPGGTTFRGPDEEVLLSEQFAATHCLRLAEAASPNEVSLAFEPAAGRTLADIRGTLALDRHTAALLRLEFTFVNVPRDVQREKAGGRIFFRALPGGGWIVDRWTMRFPTFERISSDRPGRVSDIRSGGLRREESLRLHAMIESGGEVTEVARGDSILWQLDRPRLIGMVRDAADAPVAGATVSIPTLGRRATTDADGRFALRAMRPARRTVLLATPLLDSLGLAPLVREADSRSPGEVTLRVPARDSLLATACPLTPEEARHAGFMRGTTRGPRGERLGDVRIVASWYQPPGSTRDPRALGAVRTLGTTSSATGEYSLCGVRLDQPLTVKLWVAGRASGELKARVAPESRLLLLDLGATPP